VTEAVTFWRLDSRRYAKAALSGNGAFKYGGRWNLRGTRVVYCAESRSLAAMELLVHVEDFEDLLAIEWRATGVTLPGDAIERPLRYPQSWRNYPYSAATQQCGSEWALSLRSVALRVPSAVVPGEFNFLVNPVHPDFKDLRVAGPTPFRFDPRLAQRGI
jgi:RES domain-containing protein